MEMKSGSFSGRKSQLFFLKSMMVGLFHLILGNAANEDPLRRATYMTWDQKECKFPESSNSNDSQKGSG